MPSLSDITPTKIRRMILDDTTICPCGATIADWGEACTAPLDRACEGFSWYDGHRPVILQLFASDPDVHRKLA
ncbi:MAG: hypothetical protein OXC11_02225 [Rhodospirillales bacterium]|nr:hypothetical protein [Rhodospirillales bacterium]